MLPDQIHDSHQDPFFFLTLFSIGFMPGVRILGYDSIGLKIAQKWANRGTSTQWQCCKVKNRQDNCQKTPKNCPKMILKSPKGPLNRLPVHVLHVRAEDVV